MIIIYIKYENLFYSSNIIMYSVDSYAFLGNSTNDTFSRKKEQMNPSPIHGMAQWESEFG